MAVRPKRRSSRMRSGRESKILRMRMERRWMPLMCIALTYRTLRLLQRMPFRIILWKRPLRGRWIIKKKFPIMYNIWPETRKRTGIWLSCKIRKRRRLPNIRIFIKKSMRPMVPKTGRRTWHYRQAGRTMGLTNRFMQMCRCHGRVPMTKMLRRRERRKIIIRSDCIGKHLTLRIRCCAKTGVSICLFRAWSPVIMSM